MSTPVIAFFNNKGGVGKTSLVYHAAWMFAEQGVRCVAADLDPQGNLSAGFLDEDRLEELWPREGHPGTIFGCIQPLKRGVGDVASPQLEEIDERLALLAGDMALSTFEDNLSEVWPKCLDGDERSFRIMSAFSRIIQDAACQFDANVALVDLGPNLGAINRAALIASDHIVVPLAPDLFSLQGLQNLGPTLRDWRRGWSARCEKNPTSDLDLPAGAMQPVGYVVMAHSIRMDRPVKAYDKWIERIPRTYCTSVLDTPEGSTIALRDDPNCMALLKHYRSLMPMAQEAGTPLFLLKPADGAIGSHMVAVRDAYNDFKALAQEIMERTGIAPPEA